MSARSALRSEVPAIPTTQPMDLRFDLIVVPLLSGAVPRSWAELGRLLLAVEVLSPSITRTDRDEKRKRYQRKCVSEYWIVDLEARVCERYRSGAVTPGTLTEWMEWKPDRFIDPLVGPRDATSSQAAVVRRKGASIGRGGVK